MFTELILGFEETENKSSLHQTLAITPEPGLQRPAPQQTGAWDPAWETGSPKPSEADVGPAQP